MRTIPGVQIPGFKGSNMAEDPVRQKKYLTALILASIAIGIFTWTFLSQWIV